MPEVIQNETKSEIKPVIGTTGRKIIYDKDGKPCRSCNSLQDFQMVMGGSKKATKPAADTAKPRQSYEQIDPPDVEELGKSSWTLLHSIAASYPETPDNSQQSDLRQFLKLFGKFYPCWFCADDFKEYIARNEPKVDSQEKFGKWLCDAHNEVNVKIGKPKFDCNLWKQRWKDGWEEGGK